MLCVWGCAGVVGGSPPEQRRKVSNASFACLVSGGGQPAVGVCFRTQTVFPPFRAGSTVALRLNLGSETSSSDSFSASRR